MLAQDIFFQNVPHRLEEIYRLFDLYEKLPIANIHNSDSLELKQECPNHLNIDLINFYHSNQHAAYGRGHCFARDDIDHIASVVRQGVDAPSSSDRSNLLFFTHYILLMVELRLTNLVDGFIHNEFNIIPLGENCLPRALSTKWGFKKPRALGEFTLPFDLSLQSFETASRLIRNSFENYLDDRFLTHDVDTGHCTHSGYRTHSGFRIRWPHESGLEWRENNFQKLKDRYSRRVSNFYKVLKEPKIPVLFLHIERPFSSLPIAEIEDLIFYLEKLSNQPVSLVCLNTFYRDPASEPVGLRLRKKVGLNDFSVYDLPPPLKGYEWWIPIHYISLQGLTFEYQIIHILMDALQSIKPVPIIPVLRKKMEFNRQ